MRQRTADVFHAEDSCGIPPRRITIGKNRYYNTGEWEGNAMRELQQTFRRWHRNFGCRHIPEALGDETRQHLILSMMQMGQCEGCGSAPSRKRRAFRPAVSHHLQILKQAGLLKVRREGTKNYYYFDADMEAMNSLIQMLEHAKQVMAVLPERTNDE
ncbi:MAG: ArsR/SmtB family transcription factor [Merdibacter sp.]